MRPLPVGDSALYVMDLSGFLVRAFKVRGNQRWAHRAVLDAARKVVGGPRAPGFFAAALDLPGRTFRHDLSLAYKATRKDDAPAYEHALLLEQQRWAVEALWDGLGVRSVGAAGFEADDVVATLCARARSSGMDVVVMAYDKDFAQLVDRRTVLWDGKQRVRGEAEVFDEFGVEPRQFVDYLALVGDKSDNVRGVRGVGPEGAKRLLQHFDTLDAALSYSPTPGDEPLWASWHKSSAGQVYQRVLDGRADAMAARELVRLRTDVPLPFEWLDELKLEVAEKSASGEQE